MATIYLLRHSETEYSRLHNVCGVSDPPLSEQGIARAKSRAHVLDGLRFGTVCSSPSRRCIQTLELMLPGVAGKVDGRLREIHFGELEGKPIPEVFHESKDVPGTYVDDWKTYNFTGGDSVMDYFRRAGETAREYADGPEDDAVLIVSHNGFIACVLANLVSEDIDKLFTVPIPTCALIRITREGGSFGYQVF